MSMQAFHLRELSSKFPRLTQNFAAGFAGQGLPTPISGSVRPVSMQTVHMASHTGDFFYELGRGQIDPKKLAGVMLHYAATTPSVLSVESTVDEYVEYHRIVSTNATLWRDIVAFTVGVANDRAQKPDSMGRMPAEAVRDKLIELTKNLVPPSASNDMYAAILGDFMISMLSELGIILPGTPLVYRIHRVMAFPNYQAYVDVVRIGQFSRLLEALASSDMKLVKKQMEKKEAISPSFISTQLSSSCIRALDRMDNRHNANHVVESVLAMLGATWSPLTPEAAKAPMRVQSANGYSKLLGNCSIFAAYQEFTRINGAAPFCHYDEEMMANVIFPLFMESIDIVSPYQERTVHEAVGHMGWKSVSEYDGTKTHAALYENWIAADRAPAFVPVKNSRTGFGRFLIEERSVSDALSGALKPIVDTFNVQRFVSAHLNALSAATPGSVNVKANGLEVFMALPSLGESAAMLGVTAEALSNALSSVEEFVPPLPEGVVHTVSDSEGLGSDTLRSAARRGEALLHAYYVLVLCFAVSRGGALYMSGVVSGAAETIVLQWHVHSSTPIPLGESGILGNLVVTTEPLEAIAYGSDIEPATAVQASSVNFTDHDRALHVWNWHAMSARVVFDAEYETVIAGKAMVVKLDVTDMLSLGYRRDRLRFMLPLSASAIATMWSEWYTQTEAELIRLSRVTKDSAAREAIAGRRLAASVGVVQRLRAIGRTQVGLTIGRLVNNRLVAELRGAGAIDAMKALYVAPHQIHLEAWTGLIILQMLQVLSPTEALKLAESISKSSAMATVMTMGLNDQF
jgi:hypothetical protein